MAVRPLRTVVWSDVPTSALGHLRLRRVKQHRYLIAPVGRAGAAIVRDRARSSDDLRIPKNRIAILVIERYLQTSGP